MAGQATPLGIIAAAGPVPLHIAKQVQAAGREVVVITLKSIADADYSGITHHELRLGAISEIMACLTDEGVSEVVLAGQFKRPKMASLLPDLRGANLARRALAAGDDDALRLVKEEFAKDSIKVVDLADILPQEYAPEGVIAGLQPDQETMDAINLGASYLKLAGEFDIGQSCVIEAGRILAVEAAEGTDAMLVRAGGLHDTDVMPLVMVKILKPSQDRSLDPPAIGIDTIKAAATAGINHIAIEAGGVIIIDHDQTLNLADELGVGIWGISPS